MRLKEEHAAALALAATEPPEVREHRERVARLQAEHAAMLRAANEELRAAMTGR